MKGTLLSDNSGNIIIQDSASRLSKAGFEDSYIAMFTDKAVDLLNDYARLIGENTEIEYFFVKGLVSIELRIIIPGKQYDPFNAGNGAKKRRLASVVSMNLNTETAKVSYHYTLGRNILSVSLPLTQRHKSIFKSPVVIAVVLGVVLGILCRQLPEGANSFIVDDIASPILSIILGILSEIMGPVIFISLITAIIAMGSINDLTNLGFKIIGRFVVIILFMIGISMVVSAFFFHSFGNGTVSFAPQQLIQIFLDIIPTNPIRPFIDNKTPQIVILGVVMGAALLLLGNNATELKAILTQCNEWIMSAMKIVLCIMPAIPFLSLFTTIAKGNGREILQGWKFIVASYIVYTICVAVKFIKTSVRTGIRIRDLWAGMESIVKMAFATGSNAAPIKRAYEISEKDFNIKPEFTSFWIPMCSAMLSPKTTINTVLAAFMVAEMTGMAISTSFLMVLILVALELSIASTGTTSAWAIVFASLSMPTSYVGLFAVYRLLTVNYGAACIEAYVTLEEVEAAHKLGGIKQEA